MSNAVDIGISRKAFDSLRSAYRRRWGISLQATDPDGVVIFGASKRGESTGRQQARREAIAEALRWGEATVSFCPPDSLIWAVPLMRNAVETGGLVATTSEQHIFPDETGRPALDIRTACANLRWRAEEENLTNSAFLATRRAEYAREQRRAEAIHLAKIAPPPNIRAMYLRDEPALLAAIRKDDRPQARDILNRLFTAMYHQAGHRLDLIKSFVMELVVMMCRTAVEAGGNSEELFGTNFTSISELATIESDETLAPWLHEMLERIMDAIATHRRRPAERIASDAWGYMSEHFSEPLTRDDVAEAVGVSPSHFSRLFRSQVGRTFTDVLNQLRVDRAAEFLVRSDKPIVLIAMQTGFADQSYFTKVFRRHTGKTPAQYRKAREVR